FRYKYAYYYFVARYLKDNLDEQGLETRTALNEMADKIYYEEFSNVLMFFVYLTRDRGVIERLIGNAEQIYAEHGPCDFDSDVAFINKLSIQPATPLTLPSEDQEEHRKVVRQELDRAALAEGLMEVERSGDRRISYNRELDDFIKMNIALKTLEMLGQVLRNFPGSLRGDLKARLTKQAYLLGLRTIRAL